MKTKLFTTVICSLMLLGLGCSSENEPNVSDNGKEQPVNLQEEEPDVLGEYYTIAQGELYGGGTEGIAKQNTVISTKTEWDNLKAKMNSVNTVTDLFTENEIDFTKYQVLAVFDEIKSSGGWSIDIVDVTEYADSIVVSIKNLQTGGATSVITQPFHIVKIPVYEKKIVFNRESVYSSCIMDTLQGEWNWVKTYTGFLGTIVDNEFKSVLKIDGRNEDASIHYESFVADTLFFKGTFRFEQTPWTNVVIKLPHWTANEGNRWNLLLQNENWEVSKDTICFFSGNPDDYMYYYKKIQ